MVSYSRYASRSRPALGVRKTIKKRYTPTRKTLRKYWGRKPPVGRAQAFSRQPYYRNRAVANQIANVGEKLYIQLTKQD